MNNPEEKVEKEKNKPLPPGSPDRTPIENPDEVIPMGDLQTQKDKSPRMK